MTRDSHEQAEVGKGADATDIPDSTPVGDPTDAAPPVLNVSDEISKHLQDVSVIELTKGGRSAVIGVLRGVTVARVQPDDVLIAGLNADSSSSVRSWLRGRTASAQDRDSEYLAEGVRRFLQMATSGGLISKAVPQVKEGDVATVETVVPDTRSTSETGSKAQDEVLNSILDKVKNSRADVVDQAGPDGDPNAISNAGADPDDAKKQEGMVTDDNK
jgi:hypothetical protein